MERVHLVIRGVIRRDTGDSTQHIAQFATNSVKASPYAHMCVCAQSGKRWIQNGAVLV